MKMVDSRLPDQIRNEILKKFAISCEAPSVRTIAVRIQCLEWLLDFSRR
jgi:hypothetical protein